MGATIDEVVEDYTNYYGVEKGSEKYEAVVNSNIVQAIQTSFKVNDACKADLVAEAEAYLMKESGMSADEEVALKSKLGSQSVN